MTPAPPDEAPENSRYSTGFRAGAYNTGLVYLPAQNNSSYYVQTDDFVYQPGTWNTGTQLRGRRDLPDRPELTGPSTLLLAWDPVTNREVWRAPAQGGNGGTLSTGGNLVFRGSGARLIALDARSGLELWATEVGNGPATPMTYELDGKQYVSIQGGISGGRMWTFALDGPS